MSKAWNTIEYKFVFSSGNGGVYIQPNRGNASLINYDLWDIEVIEDNYVATKTVYYFSPYGTLPTPLKEGYTFKGWNGKNLFDPDIMAITNTTHVSGTEEITFASGVYDRIMPIASWTPKINTNYSLVIQILQNSFREAAEVVSLF